MSTSEALEWLLRYPDPEVGKMVEVMVHDLMEKVKETGRLQAETEEILSQTQLDQAYIAFGMEANRQEMAALEKKLKGY